MKSVLIILTVIVIRLDPAIVKCMGFPIPFFKKNDIEVLHFYKKCVEKLVMSKQCNYFL